MPRRLGWLWDYHHELDHGPNRLTPQEQGGAVPIGNAIIAPTASPQTSGSPTLSKEIDMGRRKVQIKTVDVEVDDNSIIDLLTRLFKDK